MSTQESGVVGVDGRDHAVAVLQPLGTPGRLESRSEAKLDRKRWRMERELAKAKDIQRKLFRIEFPRYGYLDIGGVSESSDALGGDYLDVVERAGNRAAFVVADVAGKGLSAALLNALLQGGLAALASTPEPIGLVAQLNRYLWSRSDANRYATAIVGEIGEDGVVEYVNAGHLSGLLARRDSVMEVLESECFPIGMFPDADFRWSSACLERGDMLILFTDGLTEARNATGEEFGMERLAAALAANRHLPAQDAAAAILSSVAEFSDGQPADDKTLLVLRYTGQARLL